MKVAVIGSTRGTGKLLVEQLANAGHDVRGMIRDPEQADAVRASGATPVVGDLEGDLSNVFEDVEAVAFCAGSGSSTGPDATLRVDLHGAVRTIDLAVQAGARRYVMLSSIRAGDPLSGRREIWHYLAAKHGADRILEASGLGYTVVRPGGLTHDPGTGKVQIGVPSLPEFGPIPRADVAAVMAACLEDDHTIGKSFELISGDTRIAEALKQL